MTNSYPLGVTGFESQIVGGDQRDAIRAEFCDQEDCKMYGIEDVEADVRVEVSYGTEYYSWKCPTCGESRDIENNIEGEN
jgi:RNase P subunit RPR2